MADRKRSGFRNEWRTRPAVIRPLFSQRFSLTGFEERKAISELAKKAFIPRNTIRKRR
jgi:hypothetical protein